MTAEPDDASAAAAANRLVHAIAGFRPEHPTGRPRRGFCPVNDCSTPRTAHDGVWCEIQKHPLEYRPQPKKPSILTRFVAWLRDRSGL